MIYIYHYIYIYLLHDDKHSRNGSPDAPYQTRGNLQSTSRLGAGCVFAVSARDEYYPRDQPCVFLVFSLEDLLVSLSTLFLEHAYTHPLFIGKDLGTRKWHFACFCGHSILLLVSTETLKPFESSWEQAYFCLSLRNSQMSIWVFLLWTSKSFSCSQEPSNNTYDILSKCLHCRQDV